MEKTFLKIARYALLVVITLCLLVTAAGAVYGAFEFLPSSKPKPPVITIKLQDVISAKGNTSTNSGTAPSQAGNPAGESGANQQCKAILPKINQVLSKTGEKKTNQVFNPGTMQYQNQTVIDYENELNEGICGLLQSAISEQNAKLAPYFPDIDLTNTYYSNLSAYLDEALADSSRNQALQPGDQNRYDFIALFEGFNQQFDRATDKAKDDAESKTLAAAAKKMRGAVALYAAGSAFLFFFSCCLILVFIRIELNTRELVEVIRASELAKGAPTSIPAPTPTPTP